MASGTLFDQIAVLVDRVVTLEARVDDLDAFRVAHSAGAVRRQSEVDGLRGKIERDRWMSTLRRGR